jgi:hypothetical protein
MADFKVPQHICVASTPLPRNAGGKLVKARLRALVEWEHRFDERPGKQITPGACRARDRRRRPARGQRRRRRFEAVLAAAA